MLDFIQKNENIIKGLYERLLLNLTPVQKFEEISEFFLGQDYRRGALGEGLNARFDESPLFRTDAFDCLTYVNTVLALYFSRGFNEFVHKMAAINYRHGVISYENRFHFMSVDWNKENARQGFIFDGTSKIIDKNGCSLAVMAETLIDRPAWFRHRQLSDIKLQSSLEEKELMLRLQELRSLGDRLSPEMGRVPYLPLCELFDIDQEPNKKIFQQIPHGSIIEIVRPQWDLRATAGTFLDISHLGFAIRRNDELIFREASSISKKVSDTPLVNYLKNILKDSTIKGINIQLFLPISSIPSPF
jgi:hypothetical protein